MKPARIAAATVATLAVLAIGTAFALAGNRSTMAPTVGYTLLDGRPAAIDQLRGKVVLVNFWATTCAPCLQEMPRVVAMHEKFKARGYDTLAVAMRYDPPASVVHYAETRQLPFGIAIDNTGEIAQRFGDVELTPTSILIDRRGQIVKRYVGEPDFVALQALVEKLLAEPA